MNINNYSTLLIRSETYRLYVRIEHAPLARPIFANTSMTVDGAALHAVGPLHVRLHGRQGDTDVAGIESLIRALEQRDIRFRHRIYRCFELHGATLPPGTSHFP